LNVDMAWYIYTTKVSQSCILPPVQKTPIIGLYGHFYYIR
jgi:hypothetical protein